MKLSFKNKNLHIPVKVIVKSGDINDEDLGFCLNPALTKSFYTYVGSRSEDGVADDTRVPTHGVIGIAYLSGEIKYVESIFSYSSLSEFFETLFIPIYDEAIITTTVIDSKKVVPSEMYDIRHQEYLSTVFDGALENGNMAYVDGYNSVYLHVVSSTIEISAQFINPDIDYIFIPTVEIPEYESNDYNFGYFDGYYFNNLIIGKEAGSGLRITASDSEYVDGVSDTLPLSTLPVFDANNDNIITTIDISVSEEATTLNISDAIQCFSEQHGKSCKLVKLSITGQSANRSKLSIEIPKPVEVLFTHWYKDYSTAFGYLLTYSEYTNYDNAYYSAQGYVSTDDEDRVILLLSPIYDGQYLITEVYVLVPADTNTLTVSAGN